MDPDTCNYMLDYKHNNLTDDVIGQFLEDLSLPSNGRIYMDLSFNRFTETGLEEVISFMENHNTVSGSHCDEYKAYPDYSHIQVSCCVGYNHFNFPGFYRILSNMQHTQWVESGRIHLGTTALERKLDKIAAVQEKNSTGMTSLQDALNTLKSVVESDARSIVELMDTSSNLNNWAVNQRECYEYLIESVLCQHLSAKGYADIDVEPEKFRKVPFHHNLNGEPMAAVEWDAVITCEFGGKSFLFLVEAKKTRDMTGMRNMPERIERTVSFISKSCRMVETGEHKKLSRFESTRMYMWSRFSEYEVRSALAADVIPEEAMDMSKAHGFVTISSSHDGYRIDDWLDGSTAVVSQP